MQQLLLLSCLLIPIHCRIRGFYLLDQNKEYTNDGLLIADKISGHTQSPDNQIGSVCDDNFDDNAAAVICREMNFNMSLSYHSGVGTKYSSWRMRREFDIVLDDITCDSPDLPFSSCSIVTEHDCNVKQEQVFLSCGCSSDHYIRPQYKGCAPCPAGSVLSKSDNMSCVCGAGLIWDNEQCTKCPVNTYKESPDESPCQECPEHSIAGVGAEQCICEAGYFWNNDNCFTCPAGTSSSQGSVVCVSCPSGSDVIHGKTACSCAAGLHWNTTHCTSCPENTYSTQNSTTCSSCPENTLSEPGSAHCNHCAPGHVWQNYTCVSCSDIEHDSCPKYECPPGYTITTGNMCIEDKAPEQPEEHKIAPKNTTTIVLAVCLVVLFAFFVILVLLLFRTRRRRAPPKSAAPLVPYTAVRDSPTSYNYEEPEYERPNLPGQTVIYEEPRGQQYVEPEDPMYVQSDRGEEPEDSAYVQADSVPGYSVFCGNERESNEDSFTGNIYDNI